MSTSCACFVVLSSSGIVSDGATLFCKNAGRPCNEPLEVIRFRASDYPIESLVHAAHERCGAVQARLVFSSSLVLRYVRFHFVVRIGSLDTALVGPILLNYEKFYQLLTTAFRMFGAEMGTNEHDVVIGLSSIPSKVQLISKEKGMIGHDVLRLALERGACARECVRIIGELIEAYGQDGSIHSPDAKSNSKKPHCDTSFLVVDRKEGWVVETAGRQWVAQRITKRAPVRAISNFYTIGAEYDQASANVVAFAAQRGWCKPDGSDFHFARCYGKHHHEWLGQGWWRAARIEGFCRDVTPKLLTVEDIIAVARDHHPSLSLLQLLMSRTRDRQAKRALASDLTPSSENPTQGLFSRTICSHAGACLGPVQLRTSCTTGSMVSHLPSRAEWLATHFVTATSSPCLSIYKPVWVDCMPSFGHAPALQYHSESLWWRHLLCSRFVLADYEYRVAVIRPEQTRLEHDFIMTALDASRGRKERNKVDNRAMVTQRAIEETWQALNRWMHSLARCKIDRKRGTSMLYSLTMRRFNEAAKMPRISYRVHLDSFELCVALGFVVAVVVIVLFVWQI